MSIRKRIKDFFDSRGLNQLQFTHYFDRAKELRMAMYEWQNLPEGIDERFLELTLFERGCAVFFKDEEMGKYLALPVSTMGGFNQYRVPIRRRAFASNGYNHELTIDNSVIIYNNMLRKPSTVDCELYAKRLANFDRTIDVNINAQKTPVLITCDEKERLTLTNLYMQYEGNMPVIFGDKNLSTKEIKAITTQAPFIADKIYTLKTQYWNEMLTMFGISNVNFMKKERLISDEVTRAQGGTIASRYSSLSMRQQACEQINSMFGLDIWCEYREDFREMDDEFMIDEDGTIKTMIVDTRTRSPLKQIAGGGGNKADEKIPIPKK